MVVRIEFDTDNDAFVGRRKDEICKVLRDCIKGVKEGDITGMASFPCVTLTAIVSVF